MLSGDGKMKLKIKRNEYEISEDDEFMDNGACVQLLTQSQEKSYWGHSPSPKLSKRAIKEIGKYKHVLKDHGYGEGVKVFSLDL